MNGSSAWWLPARKTRPGLPLNIALVIDRSGSMGMCEGGCHPRRVREPYEPIEKRRRPENKLETVKRATLDILDRLTPADRFALVTYDDDIAVPIPSGNIEDVDRARDIVQSLETGRSLKRWMISSRYWDSVARKDKNNASRCRIPGGK